MSIRFPMSSQFHRRPFFITSFFYSGILLSVFFAASLIGCAKHDNRVANYGTPDEAITYGVYSAQTQDGNGFATKISMNPNHTYSKKKFQDACLRMEYKGEWKYLGESLEFHLQEIRKRGDCNSEDWQVDKQDAVNPRIIRNVTTNSFELLDQEEDKPATWVHFKKR